MTDKASWKPDGKRREVWQDFFDTGPDRVLFSDDSVVILSDRTPKASTHLLVIPRFEPIPGTESLRKEHLPLLLHMRDVGERLCAEQSTAQGKSGDGSRAPMIVGFHRKPTRSVEHLHLHVMQPPFTPHWNRVRYTEPPKFLPFLFIRITSMIHKIRQRSSC